MKRIVIFALTLCLMFGMFSTVATADTPNTAEVFVTVVIVENGAAKIAWAGEVSLVDTLTVDAALAQAHELGYTGGAEAGYASSDTQYGRSLDKLWGVANGGSYGYTLNDTFANSLSDSVENGDRVTAYVYEMGVCDTYAYFDSVKMEGKVGQAVELTLSALSYDPVTWEPTVTPVSGATLTLNGEDTAAVTDENGKVVLSLTSVGKYTVSAKKAGVGLVSPICVLNVFPSTSTDIQPDTAPTTTDEKSGCGSVLSGTALMLSALMAGWVMVNKRRENR